MPSTAAWRGWQEFRVARRAFEDRSRSQCSFYLEPIDGSALPPFLPGQFLTFSLIVADSEAPQGASRAITRCYSLSDRPDPAHYRVTIKRVPPPSDRPDVPAGASSNHFHDHVHQGDVLKVKAPAGHFVIDSNTQPPAVLIAGGIGITPMMSMLRWIVAEQSARTVHLSYGVRNGGEHAFKELLEQLAAQHPNVHLNVAYSRPEADDLAGRDYQHAIRIEVAVLRHGEGEMAHVPSEEALDRLRDRHAQPQHVDRQAATRSSTTPPVRRTRRSSSTTATSTTCRTTSARKA